ncbi:hypothetical protein FA13DRAFT_1770781 [Coprinellus micaceus]|uniref:Uncharacterized protein n=1 Tax=Coprinellus micaceus TaxID=71717 RepID=A0A4Y7TTE4_COPMI|nr:hypothetical protein FA13DRAFT_1770781 [Coprinellus micaceus]
MQRPPIDIESAIQVLTAAFQDQRGVDVCSRKMQAAVSSIEVALAEASLSDVRLARFLRSCPELLRAGARFVTYKRTQAKQREVVDSLCSWRCDYTQPGMAGMHAVIEDSEWLQWDSKDSSTQVILNTLHSLGYIMSLALTRLTQNKFYGKNDVNNAGQLLRPQGLHDLLPYGLEDCALGQDLWLREHEGHLVYTVVIAFMDFHVPFKAALIRPPDYTDCAGAWRMMLCSPTGNALLKSSIPLLEELYGIISPAQIGEFPGRGRTQTCLKIMLAYAASDGRFDEQGFLDCSELDQIVNKYDPKFHPEAYPDDYKFQQALAVIQWARRGTCLNIGCPDTYDASYAKLCTRQVLRRKGRGLRETLGPGGWARLVDPHLSPDEIKEICSKKGVMESVLNVGEMLIDTKGDSVMGG